MCGCARRPFVVSFEPKDDFRPRSASDLLSELNAHVSFEVAPQDFLSEIRSGRLVGMVILNDRQERKQVRQKLEESETLLIVHVGRMSEDMEEAFARKREALSRRDRPVKR